MDVHNNHKNNGL